MLTIYVPGIELFDENTNRFTYTEAFELELEHSLVSLSKWESTFHKAFMAREQKTDEETLGYIKAMTLTPNVPSDVYSRLSSENIKTIDEYINDEMTATKFYEQPGAPRNRELVTAEIIRYWMVSLNVPVQYETMHLNQLFAVIRTINLKNAPKKKMGRKEAAEQQRRLNAERRAKYGTSG